MNNNHDCQSPPLPPPRSQQQVPDASYHQPQAGYNISDSYQVVTWYISLHCNVQQEQIGDLVLLIFV